MILMLVDMNIRNLEIEINNRRSLKRAYISVLFFSSVLITFGKFGNQMLINS